MSLHVLRTTWHAWFVAHPAAMGESYVRHAMNALHVAGLMAVGACAAFVHAWVPGWFTTTASDAAARVVDAVNSRRRHVVMHAPVY